jgi:bla regulator protein blaR1
MTNSVCWVASYLINTVWEVPLIAAAGWAASRVLKRLGPAVEHVVWVSTLVLAVLTPALPVWRWFSGLVYGMTGLREHFAVTLVTGNGAAASAANAAVLSPQVIYVLLALYTAALMYFAGRLGRSLHQTVQLLREASPMALDASKERIWRHCLRTLSISDASVLRSERVTGPVTISLRRPALLVPPGFSEGCSDDDFLAAISHECAHIERKDFLKNLLYEAMSLPIAFHPVTWMVKSQIAETREMICDEIATSRVIDSQSYTESLLRLASMVSSSARAISFHAIGIFDANILEKRIMMIQAKKRRVSLWVRYGLIVPSALVLLSAAVGAGRMAVAIAPHDSAKTSKEVYKIGKDVSAPVLISSVDPEFPQSERGKKDKFEGTCLVGLTVDENGVPQDVHVVRSLQQDFDEAAIKAVQQYRFKPGMKAGTPVAVSLKVEVNFQRF